MRCRRLVDEADARAVEHREVGGLVELAAQVLQREAEHVGERVVRGGAEPREAGAQPDPAPGAGAHQVLVGERLHEPVDRGLRECDGGRELAERQARGGGLERAQHAARAGDRLDAGARCG